MKDLTPVILFVFNRAWHTRKTIEALQRNEYADESDLYIFSDGPRHDGDMAAVREVRDYLKTIKGFNSIEIIEREHNKGLANSIIDGVSKTIMKSGRIIVLEDDLLTSSYFLRFMNEALDLFEDDKRIFTITGYSYPIAIPAAYYHDIYIDYRSSSWGWASWIDRWEKIDWDVKDFRSFKNDKKAQKLFNRSGTNLTEILFQQMSGKVDSWAIRRTYSQFRNNAFTVFPKKSLIMNIGLDGSGVHCRKGQKSAQIASDFCPRLETGLQIDETINQQIRKLNSPGTVLRFVRKVARHILRRN